MAITVRGVIDSIGSNKAKAIAIGSSAAVLGGAAITVIRARRSKSKTTGKTTTRKTSKRKSTSTKRKSKSTSTKRTSSSGRKSRGKVNTKKIHYTKNGQPYVYKANGQAKFISKRSAKASKKRKGGRY